VILALTAYLPLAAIIVALLIGWRLLMSVQDQINELQGDVDTLTGVVSDVVKEIADLKAQLGAGQVITQDQIDALEAIHTKAAKAVADLQAGE
jgi:hypothetical protein